MTRRSRRSGRGFTTCTCSVYADTSDVRLDDRSALLDPGWPRMAFLEHGLPGDPTNWWAPGRGVRKRERAAR